MPITFGVLLAPGVDVPQPLRIPIVSGSSESETICRILDVPKVTGPIETDVGALYSVPQDPRPDAVKLLRNPVASALLQQYCKNMPNVEQHGRCFLLDRERSTTNKRHQKPIGEKPPKGPSKSLKAAQDIFRNLTGRDPSAAKKRKGPHKALKPLDFFKTEYHAAEKVKWESKALSAWNELTDAAKKPFEEKANEKSNKDKTPLQLYTTEFRKAGPDFTTREKEIREKWATMSDEAKQPYVTRSEEDKVRFEGEKKALMEKVRPKPRGVRMAHYVYKEQNPDSKEAWTTLADDVKAPYLAAEQQDRIRFEAEWAVYKEACDRLGLPCNEKQRKRKVPEASDSAAAPAGVKRKVAAKPEPVAATKRRKTVADQDVTKAKKPKAVASGKAESAAPAKKMKPKKVVEESAAPKKKKRKTVVAPTVESN